MVFTELRYRFSQIGASGLASKITELRGKQLALVESTHGLRTAYLYLAFGFLAAGAMMARAGAVLTDISKKNIEAFSVLEYQTIATASIMRATTKDAQMLQNAFSEVGKVTEYTSAEAAEVGRVFALAGKKFTEFNETVTTIRATLALATVAEMGHTDATRFAIDVTTQFNLKLEDLGATLDLIATGATRANLTVSELAVSLSYAGAAAEVMGISLSDTVSWMMLAADAGIRGGRAGRYFREGITRLDKAIAVTTGDTIDFQQASDHLAATAESLGVELRNEAGEIASLSEIMYVLKEAHDRLDPSQRTLFLNILLGQRAYSTWASVMSQGSEVIKENSLALESAQAIWVLQEQLNVKGAETLIDLRKQWEACGKGVIEFDRSFEKLSDDQKKYIADVIRNADSVDALTKATQSYVSMLRLQELRLESLWGAMELYQSSLERLHEVLGAAIAPQIVWFYDRMREFVDALADMHPWILKIVAVAVLVAGALLSWGGQIMMVLGGVFMLVAALAILVTQREANIRAILYEQNVLRGLNITYAQASVMASQTAASTFNLRTGFQLLSLQLGITSASFGLLMRSMMLHMSLAAIPMIISMGLIAEGAETQNEWFSRLGLITMFVLTPALQMLTLAQVRLTIAKAWDKIVTAGLITVTWLWIGSMAAASGALGILTAGMFVFMGVTIPLWAVLLAVVAAVAAIIILFKKWDTVTEKLGFILEKVFVKRRSPAFWEALKLSAEYAAENVRQFKALVSVSERFGRTGIARVRGVPIAAAAGGAGTAVRISMFEGARINLTKEAMPEFRSIVDSAVEKTLDRLERMI